MKAMRLFNRKNRRAGDTPATGDAASPVHIAIIMDGNGRWAKRRGLPRSAGHSRGASVFRTIVRHCGTIGVKYLTLYAFSTENWKRPKDEIDTLLRLFHEYIDEIARDYQKYDMRIRFIGDLSAFAPELMEKIRFVEEQTASMSGICVNVALNYGGRQEILQAVRGLCAGAKEGLIRPEDIDEALFSEYLFTAGQPDPDLIIRPSGEKRLSNFLLWQSAYTEFVYMDVLWPDFTPAHLDSAIAEYRKRNRRFGGI